MGELFRAHTHDQTEQGELFRAQDARHGGVETNDTSATTDADQRETTSTNARPQTATIETTITSATKKRTQNAHFSPAKAMPVSVEARPAPAKAMPVSIPHEHERAKAMAVSDKWAIWPTGPRCDTRGRRQGLAGQRVDAQSTH